MPGITKGSEFYGIDFREQNGSTISRLQLTAKCLETVSMLPYCKALDRYGN